MALTSRIGKKPLGRPRHSWEDNINMDRQQVGCGDMDWIELGKDRDRVACTFGCGNEISGSVKCRKFLTSRKPVRFSRRTQLHGVIDFMFNKEYNYSAACTNVCLIVEKST
jgi:hypothetical protein